ncbi:MAG: hypothetical protein WC205_01910 [Opitutaceae bacterium]|jgi:hypothetical protein
MSLFDSWLQPLRSYPRWFVLICFAITAGAIIWVGAKALKWSVYTFAMVAFVVVNVAFAIWLWT